MIGHTQCSPYSPPADSVESGGISPALAASGGTPNPLPVPRSRYPVPPSAVPGAGGTGKDRAGGPPVPAARSHCCRRAAETADTPAPYPGFCIPQAPSRQGLLPGGLPHWWVLLHISVFGQEPATPRLLPPLRYGESEARERWSPVNCGADTSAYFNFPLRLFFSTADRQAQ